MTLENLTDLQRQAFLDLVILGIYADGHLASVEDARVQRLLASMGYSSDYDRGRVYDEAVSRVSRHSQTAAATRDHTTTLARHFTSNDERRWVLDQVNDVLTSDQKLAAGENSFLAILRAEFEM